MCAPATTCGLGAQRRKLGDGARLPVVVLPVVMPGGSSGKEWVVRVATPPHSRWFLPQGRPSVALTGPCLGDSSGGTESACLAGLFPVSFCMSCLGGSSPAWPLQTLSSWDTPYQPSPPRPYRGGLDPCHTACGGGKLAWLRFSGLGILGGRGRATPAVWGHNSAGKWGLFSGLPWGHQEWAVRVMGSGLQ